MVCIADIEGNIFLLPKRVHYNIMIFKCQPISYFESKLPSLMMSASQDLHKKHYDKNLLYC